MLVDLQPCPPTPPPTSSHPPDSTPNPNLAQTKPNTPTPAVMLVDLQDVVYLQVISRSARTQVCVHAWHARAGGRPARPLPPAAQQPRMLSVRWRSLPQVPAPPLPPH